MRSAFLPKPSARLKVSPSYCAAPNFAAVCGGELVGEASANHASCFHHTCSSPHAEQRVCVTTSRVWRKLYSSVSMPVKTAWPVFGHLIMSALNATLLLPSYGTILLLPSMEKF